MPVSTTIAEGTVISGKYRVGRELGRGGMAAVYEAMNLDIRKRVAIKLLAGHLTTSQTVVERFLREARAVAQIRSPHICDVYDAGKLEDGTPYLVLELLEGESLYDAMVRDRQMSTGLTLAIVLQVCRGLSKAHDMQIVHRDLKPENIFLTVDDDGQLLVKVLDFGLAKFYDPTSSSDAPARLTREGAVFGTPVYMSPEQVRGQAAADHRADLWALACIAYECLTGATVWSTDDGVAMTFAQIATAPLPNPTKYRPDLPASFLEWYERALDRDIGKRYQNVREFGSNLASAFDFEVNGSSLNMSLITQLPGSLKTPPAQSKKPKETPQRPKETPQRKAKAAPAQAAPKTAPAQAAPKTPEFVPKKLGQKRPSAASEPMSLKRELVDTLPPRIPRVMANNRMAAAAIGAGILLLLIFWLASSGEDETPPAKLKRVATLTDHLLSSDSEQVAGLRLVSHHPWLPRIREAQMRIARGELERARTILQRLSAVHRHGMIDNLLAQTKVAIAAKIKGDRCTVTGYARPRRYRLLNKDLGPARSTSGPTIVPGIGGPVMAWSDVRGKERRAFAVPLDHSLRNRALPVDITPEASYVHAPTLIPVAKRFLAAYWDSRGRNQGVYLRWLRSNAVIDTPPVRASEQSTGGFDAHATRNANKGFLVAWAAQHDKDSIDLTLRRYTNDLKPSSGPIRATNLVKNGKQILRVAKVKVAATERWIHAVYLISEGATRQLRYQSFPATTKAPGLSDDDSRRAQTLGDEQIITTPDSKAGAPSLACTNDGCFIAWHRSHKGGAGVAFIDAATRKVQWHKLFSPKGRYPSISVSPKGATQIAWVESGRVMTASLGREGVGPRSKIGRATFAHAAVSIAPGSKRGEWYLSWLDRESSRAEPYAARMQCR